MHINIVLNSLEHDCILNSFQHIFGVRLGPVQTEDTDEIFDASASKSSHIFDFKFFAVNQQAFIETRTLFSSNKQIKRVRVRVILNPDVGTGKASTCDTAMNF